MFGSHLSIAGGMENALIAARRLDMDCVQVFTKNQRQWTAPPLTKKQIDAWHEHMASTGIRDVVSHDSYLINLANPGRAARDKSMRLFAEEMRRCDALDIPHLVMHPGAHLGAGEDKGIALVIDAFNRLHDQLPHLKVVTCVEVTAGQGTYLGYTFEHLAAIIDGVEATHRMGVCLDTAHLLAAGYDLTSAPGTRKVIRECDDTIGLDRVHVIHLNDSKVERGKRVDRHEHIGHGHVARTAFEVIVNHARFRRIPKVLETPKADAPDGRPWDAVNLETLRGMVKKRPKRPRKPARSKRP